MGWIQRLERKDGSPSYKAYWRDPQKNIKPRTFRRRKDADRHLSDIEHKKNEGTYLDPNLGKMTLEDFWDYFIRTSGGGLAESTRALYTMQARRYILPHLGSAQLRMITTKPRVKEFLADLQSEGVGAPSINSVHRLLRRVLAVAVEDSRIAVNPASRVEAPKVAHGEMHFLTAKEVAALANAVEPRYRTLVFFLAYTGARIGEAAALRRKNVDLLGRQAHIVEASKEVGGKLYLGATKTEKSRSVFLPAFLAEMMAKHIEEFVDATNKDALVFTTSTGSVVRQTGFRRRTFKPAAARAGLVAGLRPHDLRHTAVALAIEAGWHPKKIQEMVGHAGIQVTMEVYGHLFSTLHSEGADKLDAVYRAAADAQENEVTPILAARSAKTVG
jgi:integrase